LWTRLCLRVREQLQRRLPGCGLAAIAVEPGISRPLLLRVPGGQKLCDCCSNLLCHGCGKACGFLRPDNAFEAGPDRKCARAHARRDLSRAPSLTVRRPPFLVSGGRCHDDLGFQGAEPAGEAEGGERPDPKQIPGSLSSDRRAGSAQQHCGHRQAEVRSAPRQRESLRGEASEEGSRARRFLSWRGAQAGFSSSPPAGSSCLWTSPSASSAM
jgi:hypothetical protein